ncbi:hypothetical protein MMC21_003348 [Puttea exsequens]|nr:hypothetical protein [Puttea exsequens]
MRAAWLYSVLSIVLITANCPATAAGRWAILPRADAPSSTASAAPSETIKAAASSTQESSRAAASSTRRHSSSGPAASATAAANGTSSGKGTAAATSNFVGATALPIPKGSLNVTTSNTTHIDGLPIQPSITPAMSIAGAVLILSGTFYALIGIKTKWLHVYFSTAYIFALAVTILIVYVMHPPVSNGVQGAYFVAACVTGLIAGALAVTFPDTTEGLGCLIGGFCFSMWFLVLKSGGLITSTAGKIIFIACFTVGAFGFYISHYTRPYGIIASTAIAGATAIVLGIDCFSRAGLKEFWLYIWSTTRNLNLPSSANHVADLNDNIFPAHYQDRYPITRGIRVEIAAIVIISLIGTLSQMKIWQIVKQKKLARAVDQRKKNHQRNMSDEEQGRKVEDQNLQDRPLWEAIHSAKSKSNVKDQYLDSALGTSEPGTTRKNSLNDAEGMEMQDLKGSQDGSIARGRVTVHVAQDYFEDVPLAGGSLSIHTARTASDDGRIHNTQTAASETSNRAQPHENNSIIDPNLTLRPKIVSPPFKVPEPDSASDDDGSSIAASAASEHMPDRLSRRLSGSSIMRKLSHRSQRSYLAGSSSEEALVVPHVMEDDRASSRAATLDGMSDKNMSNENLVYSRGPSPTYNERNSQASLNALVAAAHNMRNPTTYPEFVQEAESVPLPRSRPASVVETTSVTEQTTVLAAENLPDGGASKVVKAYRTNEWAKHLDRADAPDVDELKINQPRSPPTTTGEAPAPLNVRALQQTPLNAEPAPAVDHTATLPSATKRRSSTFLTRNPFSKKSDPRALHPLIVAKQASRTPSQTSLALSVSRTSSQTSLNSAGSQIAYRPPLPKHRFSQPPLPPMRNHRSSSGPLASPLAESPIEEGVETSFPARFTPQPTHLMSQRDRIITSRPSSTSLLRSNSSTIASSPYRSTSTLPEEPEDNIPLSQRKSLLQQHQQKPPISRSRPQRSSTNPSGTSTPRYPSSLSNPHRSPTTSGTSTPHRHFSGPNPSLYPARPGSTTPQRHSTISAWRASLAPSASATYRDQEIERRRSQMLAEKQREGVRREEIGMEGQVRGAVVDRGMRRGEMLSAHREAMRRMQEGVKL